MAKKSTYTKEDNKILQDALDVIRKERTSLADIEKRFSKDDYRENFLKAVRYIYECTGNVIVTGTGKSGIIAKKIVATFNSTGTYSVFLHPSDGIHGDLGIVRENDVVIIVSKSGSTQEIKRLLPSLRNLNAKIISIVGNVKSELAKVSDVAIDASVKVEACPHGLAPTSSTTAALVTGDAIAVTLLNMRGFTQENFAKFHPGGNLGKKLLLKIDDIMVKGKDIPVVKPEATLKDTIYMISSKRLGCTCVGTLNNLQGFITDGDIRRLLGKNVKNLSSLTAKDIMNANPKCISEGTLAREALEFMEKNKITQLVICAGNKIKGLVHMHKLVEEGI